MAAEIFLDASYAIALASPKDFLHAKALRLAQELSGSNARLATTRAVLLEIGNALSKVRHREAAVRLLTAIEHDPAIEIHPITDGLYIQGLALFSERPDKNWGITDCISFVVMRQHSIDRALTADEHFEQAGFQALMR